MQICIGKVPYLTKGPWALFFGGHDLVTTLNDAKPGKHVLILCLTSLIFNMTILGKFYLYKYFELYWKLLLYSIQEVLFKENWKESDFKGYHCWQLYQCSNQLCDYYSFGIPCVGSLIPLESLHFIHRWHHWQFLKNSTKCNSKLSKPNHGWNSFTVLQLHNQSCPKVIQTIVNRKQKSKIEFIGPFAKRKSFKDIKQ